MQEGVKIAVTDNELRNQVNQRKYAGSGDNDAAEACDRILRELPTPASLAVTSIYLLFSKDLSIFQFHSLLCCQTILYMSLCSICDTC